MKEIPQVLIDYLAAWNETDVSKVRGHLDRSCAADVLFVDPMSTAVNIDELEQLIIKLRNERPNAINKLASGIDGHNNRYRYLWEIDNEGQFLLNGMDVTTLNADGKVKQIDGFFGSFPELEA